MANKEMRIGNESVVSYSTKELFDQIQRDLKAIITKLDSKAELAAVASLASQINERAKQDEVAEVSLRLAKLENEVATKEAVERNRETLAKDMQKTRRWIIGLAIPAIISTITLAIAVLMHLRV